MTSVAAVAVSARLSFQAARAGNRWPQVVMMTTSGGNNNNNNPSLVLEDYSRKNKSEVLLVHTEDDIVLVYKGVSSSLLKATALELCESVLEQGASIKSIDRVRAPYNPNRIEYIDQNLSWDDFKGLV